MIVLDTNVVSELMRERPAATVLAWVDAIDASELAITALTAAELRAGVALLPDGARRALISHRIDTLLTESFAGAVLAFDAESAQHYARVLSSRRSAGTPIATIDAQIAAICASHDAALATRNTRDFLGLGLDLVDPWVGAPHRA